MTYIDRKPLSAEGTASATYPQQSFVRGIGYLFTAADVHHEAPSLSSFLLTYRSRLPSRRSLHSNTYDVPIYCVNKFITCFESHLVTPLLNTDQDNNRLTTCSVKRSAPKGSASTITPPTET